MNKVMHIIPDTSMKYGHTGLLAIAKKNKINTALKPGEFILFINCKFDACKLFAANNVVIHHKNNGVYDQNALHLIPEFFDGMDINYGKALERILRVKYKRVGG